MNEIDLDAVLNIVAEQAKAVAILNGQLAALRKHSDAQAKELAELRIKNRKNRLSDVLLVDYPTPVRVFTHTKNE